jgi:hypothetical protein
VVSYTEREREQILREAANIRARHPSADADDWSRLPTAQPAAVAPIQDHGPCDLAATATPSRFMREIAELEAFDRECAAETERRRQLEQQHRQRAAAASETALLRDEVSQLAKAANTFAEAILAQVEAQAAEIAALRGRLERGLTKTPRAKKRATLPSFLPPRLSS